MPGFMTNQAQHTTCTSQSCGFPYQWKDAGSAAQFFVCLDLIVLCIVWTILNLRKPSIKVRRDKRDWEDKE